jgi:hypothetical protein
LKRANSTIPIFLCESKLSYRAQRRKLCQEEGQEKRNMTFDNCQLSFWVFISSAFGLLLFLTPANYPSFSNIPTTYNPRALIDKNESDVLEVLGEFGGIPQFDLAKKDQCVFVASFKFQCECGAVVYVKSSCVDNACYDVWRL